MVANKLGLIDYVSYANRKYCFSLRGLALLAYFFANTKLQKLDKANFFQSAS